MLLVQFCAPSEGEGAILGIPPHQPRTARDKQCYTLEEGGTEEALVQKQSSVARLTAFMTTVLSIVVDVPHGTRRKTL